ncbi:MAG: M13-type metalloendopeptidase [Tahibacter sp.]
MKSPHWKPLCIALLISVGSMTNAAENARPQYGAWGYDLTGADSSTRAGDDFFKRANGQWLASTEIPADKAGYSLRMAMSDRTEQQLRALIEHAAASSGKAPESLEGKVGAFYTSFMDETRIEAAGAKAIGAQMAAVRKAVDREGLAALMGRMNDDFEGSVFALGIDVDLKDPMHYAAYTGQSGLGLPDRDYYLNPQFAKQKLAYQAYLATLLRLIGEKRAEAQAAEVLAFETRIAEASWSRTEQRDPVATYNPMSVDELQALTPGFARKEFLRAAHLPGLKRIVVAEKSAFPKLATIYAQTPLSTLKAWQLLNIVDNAAYYLSRPFQVARFELRGKTLSGQQIEATRWKRGIHAVSGGDYGAGDRLDRFGNLGWAVGQLYSTQYFPAASKLKIEELVAHLKAAFHARIVDMEWMSAATKLEALKKLETYTIKVGYPDQPRDYASVRIRADDLVGNVIRAAQADWAFQVARFDGPVDRMDWAMTPQTNDAYNGSLRDIVFPAGILQPPIFDANADPAMNYGAAGGVIGHELTHGFDDQGRKIDADGALRDWWTEADAAAFEARAKRLAVQYSRFEPLPDLHINGDLTLGENIADLGGLTLALDAYHASLQGKPAPVLDGLSGDQRVFLGWAQAWRGKNRDDAVRRQVASDPHSPRAFRVNGVVRNIDAWYTLFDVKPAEKLYLAPGERVRIW